MNPTSTPVTSTRKIRRITIANVAGLLVATSLLGQILGFLRTKLVNSNFPAIGPHSTDAYFAAFLIPDFFFFTVAAGALGVAFMPVLSDRLHKNDRKGLWEVSSSLLNLLAIIMFVVGVVILVFARPLVHYIVAPHMTDEQLDTTVAIMRFLAFNPFLFTISGILTSMQQTFGRFFFYAIAPLFYNLSIIVSIYVFRNNIGLVGLGLGALIGAVLQLLVVLIGMNRIRFHWHPRIVWKSKDFHTVLRQLPPRSLDQGIDQLNSIVETNFARRLGEGFVSYYNNAFILSTAPVMLIGTTISTAAFPRLNARLSQGRPDLFRQDFLRVLRAMIWITIPVVIICFFARGYLARLIFSRDAPEIALIFGYLTVAIFFRIMYSIVSRWFYSQKDTKTPLFVSVFAITLNIALAYVLSRPTAYGVAGLAMAQSIVAASEVFVLSIIMVIRDNKLFDGVFWGGVGRILSASGFTLIAGYIMISFFPLVANDQGFVTLGGKLLLISGAVLLTHVVFSYMFGIEEVKPILNRLRRIIVKPIRVDL